MAEAAHEDAPLRHAFEAANPTRVSFRQFAFVHAGLADGLSLDALLEHEGIDPRDWPAGDDYWNESLLDDLGKGAALTFELDACQQLEREKWERKIPPLDEDYAAWIDFARNLLESDNPAAKLADCGLAPGDMGRLTRLWAERCARDPKLNEERLATISRPPRSVEVPRPAPPRLLGTETSVDGTGFFQALSDVAPSLPFAPPQAGREAERPLPPIATPLPRAAVRSVDETSELSFALFADAPRAATPFFSANVEAAPPSQSNPEPHRHAGMTQDATPALPIDAPPPTVEHAPAPEPDLDATSMEVIDFGDALPFAGENAAPAPADLGPIMDGGHTAFVSALVIDDDPDDEPPSTTDHATQRDQTSFLPALVVEDEPAQPALLSIEQLAAIAVELELGTPQATVLAQYRMTAGEQARQSSALHEALASAPALRARYEQAKFVYRQWRTRGGT